MSKYLIHAIPQRLWYVNEYMIPAMTEQGIDRNDIQILCDTNKRGCLEMFMLSCKMLPDKGNTWHLQDDILISSRFKEETEKPRNGIVCGFCSCYDHQNKPGEGNYKNKWFSFPCIRIPNKLAHGCANWFYNVVVPSQNEEWQRMIKCKKYDDSFFWIYIKRFHKTVKVTKLDPNIAEHVDYLIGGMVANYGRAENPISRYWYEPELTDKLFNDMMKRCLSTS